MINHRKRFGIAAGAAVAAVALAACSSSSSPTGGSTSNTSAAKNTATGSPIKVFVITALDTPMGSFPSLAAGAKAAAREINAAGGINNHPIEVDTCNGKLDPNQEVSCAQQGASSGSAAIIGSILAANPDAAQKAMQDGGIASFAGAIVSPTQLMSPIAFPLDAGPFIPAGCLAIAQSKVATKLATVSSDIAAIKTNAAQVAAGAAKLGISVVSQVTLPTTSPDVTSQVQQVFNKGADGIVMFASPSQATQVIQATSSLGKKPAICLSDGLLTAGQFKQLGAAASNLYVSASIPPLSAASSNPGVAKFIADMKAEEASGDKDASLDDATYGSNSMRAWAGVVGFAQIAKTISGTVDKTSFLAAVKKATNVTTGVFPPVDFTKSVGGPAFPSLYNGKVQLLKWNVSTKTFDTTGTSFDTTSLLGP